MLVLLPIAWPIPHSKGDTKEEEEFYFTYFVLLHCSSSLEGKPDDWMIGACSSLNCCGNYFT
eukprot:scaffold69_cov198-Alexandrium_tamarense.AAC.63